MLEEIIMMELEVKAEKVLEGLKVLKMDQKERMWIGRIPKETALMNLKMV